MDYRMQIFPLKIVLLFELSDIINFCFLVWTLSVTVFPSEQKFTFFTKPICFFHLIVICIKFLTEILHYQDL